jgi:sulfur-oxidizing protein SoxY
MGADFTAPDRKCLTAPKGEQLTTPKSKGLVEPKGRGLVEPEGRGLTAPKGRNETSHVGLALAVTSQMRRVVLVRAGQWLTAGSFVAQHEVSRADAARERLDAAIQAFSQGRPLLTDSGRLRIEIDALVENGNSVPIRVKAMSPMTETDHVQRIVILAPRNPQPQVALFHLGIHSGRAEVATRFRMAESQTIQALALFSDGRIHRAQADVVVTLAACLEN